MPWPRHVAAEPALEPTVVWLGNQWQTSRLPGRPRNNDLLYFAPLRFGQDGAIAQLEWHDAVNLSVPWA